MALLKASLVGSRVTSRLGRSVAREPRGSAWPDDYDAVGIRRPRRETVGSRWTAFLEGREASYAARRIRGTHIGRLRGRSPGERGGERGQRLRGHPRDKASNMQRQREGTAKPARWALARIRGVGVGLGIKEGGGGERREGGINAEWPGRALTILWRERVVPLGLTEDGARPLQERCGSASSVRPEGPETRALEAAEASVLGRRT